MKIILHTIKVNPNAVEEIIIEDIAGFTVDDNAMRICYNNGESESISLRANDGEGIHEWSAFSIFGTRVGLQVDMTK